MNKPVPEKALQADVLEKMLPLVVEIMPGQAAEGLIDVFAPGDYEGKSLRKLCRKLLDKKNLSIEEQLVLEEINSQLDGGMLLCRGHAVDDPAIDFAVVEETQAGEKYLYVPVRAIKPQEGGRWRGRKCRTSNRSPDAVGR